MTTLILTLWSFLSLTVVMVTALALPLCGVIFAVAAIADGVEAARASQRGAAIWRRLQDAATFVIAFVGVRRVR